MKVFGLLMDWERPGVLEGAEAYCRDRDIWLDCRWSQRPDWFPAEEAGRWDGALIHLHTSSGLCELLEECGVSIVSLRSDDEAHNSVINDYDAVAKLSVEELLERGCERILVRDGGGLGGGLEAEFKESVQDLLESKEVSYEIVKCDFHDFRSLIERLDTLRGERLGLICLHASFLTEVQLQLLESGWDLPGELMMVAMDKDGQGIAERAPVPLSAVEPDYWKRGHDGMRMLNRLCRGEVLKNSRVKVRPLGLRRRLSSGGGRLADRYVARLVELIETSFHKDVSVGQLIERVGLSRRGIEMRFRSAMGCSPLEYLTGYRLEKAKAALRTGGGSLEEVALECGFGAGSYLSRVFKKHEGVTPGEYRAGNRR